MLDGPVAPALVVVAAVVLAVLRRRLFRRRAHGPSADLLVIVAVAALSGFLQLQMGRPLTYRHGPVRLWSGDASSDQNSQQISDPYTFTHVIHGAAFYGLTRALLRSAPFSLCALVVVTLEAAWEAYENTDQVINRYRAATISLGYYGDSVVNSMADVLACIVGLLLARRLPVGVTVAWVLVIELVLAFWIRDNLTLNIIMLIRPIDAIRTWQLAA